MTPIKLAFRLAHRSNVITSKRPIQHFVKTMATAKTIKITPENTGLWHVKQTEAAAKKASELLQKDLEVSLSYGIAQEYSFAGFTK